jgi:hypothetical protein
MINRIFARNCSAGFCFWRLAGFAKSLILFEANVVKNEAIFGQSSLFGSVGKRGLRAHSDSNNIAALFVAGDTVPVRFGDTGF